LPRKSLAIVLAGVLACILCVTQSGAEPSIKAVAVEAVADGSHAHLVLDWPNRVEFRVFRTGRYIFVWFSRPLPADLREAERSLSRFLDELRMAGQARVLVIRTAGPSRFTYRRLGNALVLSWSGAGRPAAERSAAPPREKEPAAAVESGAPAPPGETKRKTGAEPVLGVTTRGDATHIAVTWPDPVPAAVFVYGGRLWIAFPRPSALAMAPREPPPDSSLGAISRIAHPQASILVAPMHRGLRAKVTASGNTWSVAIMRAEPGIDDREPKFAMTRISRDEVAVSLPGAKTVIRVQDPVVGSTLHVAPSSDRAALAVTRRFVTFKIVPAAQGAVIEQVADDLSVAVSPTGLAVRRPGGLLITDNSRDSQGQ
jgi:hypothetical protein